MPRWVSRNGVLAMHGELIAEHGGSAGLRDEGLLESALAKPQNLAAHEKATPHQLAAAYAYGLVKNHPFVDGNKRIGFMVSAVFLRLNGYQLTVTEADAAQTFIDLAAGKVTQARLAKWFLANSLQI